MTLTSPISSPTGSIGELPAGKVVVASSDHSWVVELFLQISHRLAAVALFATIGVWAMGYLGKDFYLPLAVAAGAADVGFCAAMIARMITRRSQSVRREANGVAIFNLVIFILSMYLMIFARLDVIRAAGAEFFTPSQPISSHG